MEFLVKADKDLSQRFEHFCNVVLGEAIEACSFQDDFFEICMIVLYLCLLIATYSGSVGQIG